MTEKPDLLALLEFNGYYGLKHAEGAFFAIDANLHVKDGGESSVLDISLILSLDGKTSSTFPFTGHFADGRLTQPKSEDCPFALDLRFTRAGPSEAFTAACEGVISQPPAEFLIGISGVTYNNPVPPDLFQGAYYLPASNGGAPQRVAEIGPGLLIRYADAGGELRPVHSYSYNLNMYYFTLGAPKDGISLIMGTAGAQGLACNNMYPDKTTGAVDSRSLYTIPEGAAVPPVLHPPGGQAEALAGFSGFYPLPSVVPGAFLAIQGSYYFQPGDITGYSVAITLSTDGRTTQAFQFGDGMTFSGGTLQVPSAVAGDPPLIDVTFKRGYDRKNGTLSTITGTIAPNGIVQTVTAANYLNPVPLAAFGGRPLTNASGSQTLTITGDDTVAYNQQTMTAGVYVPLMYILAGTTGTGPDAQPWVMSLGTDGAKGTACIVLKYVSPTDFADPIFIYAIPNAR
ncbi:hypothetical protein [Nitrospirillum iridis]|uniref:Uncharacterized protein n=1 Tax=Nitrospirillum iridis TaxID=765888 RepID=A0A7X0AVN1_9PROT|nr:hypothetical protein [Nitrospirillum iridis]MBB6250969.1 hypothetical protein [Nitrospirillum iridis]